MAIRLGTLTKAVFTLTLLASACGDNQPEIPLATVGADSLLFERGTKAMQEDDWRTAREYFLQVRDNYPLSPLQSVSRLGMGDTLAAEGTIESYIQALSEYRDFLARYPTHDRVDYAQYKLGMVYYQQMRSPDRDQSETHNAIVEFELFTQRYPTSQYVDEAHAHLREARDRLSESNFVVGHFYYRRKWYPGAIDRLEMILNEDPNYTERDAVYFYLADSLRHTAGRAAEALPMFRRILEEFTESEFIEDATQRIADLENTAATDDP